MRNNANITGDASLTWVITPAGNVSLKAFTRTINRYDENQGLQENGIGIYYKEDFNVFSDIGRQSKARKEARRRKRAEREEAKKAGTEREAATTPFSPAAQPTGSGADAAISPAPTTPPPAKSRIEQRREASEERRRRMREEMQRREAEARSAGQQPGDALPEAAENDAER